MRDDRVWRPANTVVLTPVAGEQPYYPIGQGRNTRSRCGHGSDEESWEKTVLDEKLPASVSQLSEAEREERVIMPVSPFTNDVMKALPAALRPNPYSIDEEVMKAVEKGWDTDALAKAAYLNDKHPNPAFVVTNIRRLCEYPPQQQMKRVGWEYGHIKCDLHDGCELCRCIPGEVHHHQPARANGRKIIP